MKNMFNSYQTKRVCTNSGAISQCPSYHQNLKHFSVFMKLYINFYRIISFVLAHLKFINPVRIEKVTNRHTTQGS